MLSEGSAVLLSRHGASLASKPESFGFGRTFTDMPACPLTGHADGAAMGFDRYQLFHGRVLGTPCGEESEITLGNVPADQQTPRPLSGEGPVVFAHIEIGQ